MSEPLPRFPADFGWGVGASSYQTEGALDVDGRGRSTWDEFCDRPDTIVDGSSGAGGTDFYHRYAEDIGLVRELGAKVYRISIAWPRILPTGSGAANQHGLDFYDRVVDEMCAAGLAPAITLFHWDTPAPVEAAGGWLHRDTALRFGEYAGLVAERLADRVAHWIPLNELMVLTMLGYATGEHAPGQRLGLGALPTAHHQLLAHGLAVQALRAAGARSIGTANPHAPQRAASDRPADVAAAELADGLLNWLWSDAMLLGRYPDGVEAAMPGPVADDLAIISAPLDFYGVNYYSPTTWGAPDTAEPRVGGQGHVTDDAPFVQVETGLPKTGLGGDIDPDGLREILVDLHDRYGDRLPPVIITENGTSQQPGTEEPDAEGRIRDDGRIAYLDAHVRALHAAMAQGVDVRGYWHWSPTDNFEWAEGYTQRFGLVHVDYATLKRTPKDSYSWFQRLIRG